MQSDAPNPGKGITAPFIVPYRAGELKAIAADRYNNVVARSLTTTGPVTNLKLTAERTTIRASHQEIVFFRVVATDHENRLVPTATLRVNISLEGEGTLLAAGNGSPLIDGSIQDKEFRLFRGRGLIILRSNGEPGSITLSVRSEDGYGEKINIKTVR